MKAAVRYESDQGVVNLRADEAKHGDVLLVDVGLGGLMVGASLSDICVVKMVMAAVDIPAPVPPYLSPTPPHNRHSMHELGDHPFCSTLSTTGIKNERQSDRGFSSGMYVKSYI